MRQIQSDVPEGPGKDALLANFTTRSNAFVALNFVSKNLPKQHQADFDNLIAKATPKQLARLRTLIERSQLAGHGSLRLLEFATVLQEE